MTEVERFTSGHAIGVDVTAIERDLAALWRKAQNGGSVTRACSWNLVVHALTDAELDRAQALTDALVPLVPSRTIILSHRPNATGPEVEAFVTAHCKLMPGGGKMVCTEEITVQARGAGGDHLPSLLRALLVPDIPTALLWAGLPPRVPVVQDLLSGVDRVVLDSAGEEGADDLSLVEQLGVPKGPPIADLNWLRLSSLRLLLAGEFDPPADPTALFRLKRLAIECTARARPAAKLLLGWLGARLSWGTPQRIIDREPPAWLVQRQQGYLLCEVVPCETALPGGIQSVTLETEKGERFRIAGVGGQVELSGVGAPHTVPAHQHSDSELLVAALGSRGNDKLYSAALHRALELERE